MTEGELIVRLRQEVKGLLSKLEPEDFTNAIANAKDELGFSLPNTSTYQLVWLRKRSKRHLIEFLLTESAHKFKFEEANLQHRFQNYRQLLTDWDKEFLAEVESRPDIFSNVDIFHLFGTKVDAGFAYDHTGEDITYLDDQLVEFGPKEND